jgi:hypothetical protein
VHDHIHRQIARSRIADQSRAQSFRARRRSFPEKPPPSPYWIQKRVAAAVAKAAVRIDQESAQRAIASR